jgi:MYXO-CTERM domain-containing protein
MTAADAGVIAAIVLGLLCLRRRRCPDGRSASEREAEDHAVMESQTWNDVP